MCRVRARRRDGRGVELQQAFDPLEERLTDRFGVGKAAGSHCSVSQHDDVPGGRFSRCVPDAGQHLTLAGYAALGGLFFLVSAVRLGRSAKAL